MRWSRHTHRQGRSFGCLTLLPLFMQGCSTSDSPETAASGGAAQQATGTGQQSGGMTQVSSSNGTNTGGTSLDHLGGQSSLDTRSSSTPSGAGGTVGLGGNTTGGTLGTESRASGGSNAGGFSFGGGASTGKGLGGLSGTGGAATGATKATSSSGGTKMGSSGTKANGGTPTSTGGTPTSTGGNTGGSSSTTSSACSALSLTQNVRVANGSTDQFTWFDATCRPRSAAMERVGGGYVRQFKYMYDGKTRTASGTGANGYNGWGFPVNHDLTNSLGHNAAGTYGELFVGPHHAFYQYHMLWPGLSDVEITLVWFFATGRSNPVLAITYDLSAASPTKYEADTRTPYGDMAWDGDENWQDTVVSGVGWGDRYRFVTTTAPLTMNSEWDYTEPNLVPYVFMWAVASDAEMGAVQTQTYEQHDAGGYWFYGNWGKTSANQTRDADQVGRMPVTWNWTYQINQYELCIEDPSCVNSTTNSHRLAWGANYGAVGSPSYPAYGDDKNLSGYPYQSYSVFMVLGKHSDEPVFNQVAEIETVQRTTLTASIGSIPTKGIGGVGRTDEITLSPVGYDHRFAMWLADAADNALAFRVVVAGGALSDPVLAVRNYSASTEPTVTQDGQVLTPGVDYFVSVDSASKTAYVTFHKGWAGTQNFELR